MTTLKRIGITAAAVTTVGLALAGPSVASSMVASPASEPGETGSATAQCRDDFTKPGVNIRSGANTNAEIRGQGNPGDCVRVHNTRYGGDVKCDDGAGNNYWYDVTDIRTGVRGWVSACYLPPGTAPG